MARKIVSVPKPAVRFVGKKQCGSDGKPVKRVRLGRPRKGAPKPALTKHQAYAAKHKVVRNAKQKAVKAAKAAEPGYFRFASKRYGLTYSQAQTISGPQELFDWLQDLLGPHLCTVSMEHHKIPMPDGSPAKHFHVGGRLDKLLKFEGTGFFNYVSRCGTVQKPSICSGGPYWEIYIRKDGFIVSNVPEKQQVMCAALKQGNVGAALNHIMVNDANSYVRFATSLEANLQRHYRRTTVKPLPKYAGPYPASRCPPDWNPETHSLHLWGPSGAGKTNYAMHLLREHFGDAHFCKGHIEALKSLDFTVPFCFDEVMVLDEPAATSRELTDVMSGGTIQARYAPIIIPPGVARIFTSNSRWVFKNPDESVYGRRVLQHEYPFVAVIEPWRLDPPRSRSPSPVPPPPPGSPPVRPRSPPPPPDTPYPWPDVDALIDLPEPDPEPEPDDMASPTFWTSLSDRWVQDGVMYHGPMTTVESPTFSPGWDFLLPFSDSCPVSVDPLADMDCDDTLPF